jgi:hypothetical protein
MSGEDDVLGRMVEELRDPRSELSEGVLRLKAMLAEQRGHPLSEEEELALRAEAMLAERGHLLSEEDIERLVGHAEAYLRTQYAHPEMAAFAVAHTFDDDLDLDDNFNLSDALEVSRERRATLACFGLLALVLNLAEGDGEEDDA